jgi:SAM-dependent methyltransferase
MLQVIKELFPQGEYHSIDLRQNMLVEGVHHYQGYFEDYDFGGKKFDIITARHFIEHIYSPLQLLQTASRLINPDGIIYISTPNVDALEFKIGRKKLYCGGYYVPRHLTLFNQRSFQHLVDMVPGIRMERLGYFFTIYHWVTIIHHWLYDKTGWAGWDRLINYKNILISIPFYVFDLIRYRLGFKTGVLEAFLVKEKPQ